MSKDESRSTPPNLVTSRIPRGPKNDGSKDSDGGVALTDALIIIGVAFGILVFFGFSLRAHNI
jgi:hypothetical protein